MRKFQNRFKNVESATRLEGEGRFQVPQVREFLFDLDLRCDQGLRTRTPNRVDEHVLLILEG